MTIFVSFLPLLKFVACANSFLVAPSSSFSVIARVIIDMEQNRSRGFGFVTFASTEEASSAIQAMDGQFMSRRNLLETSNYLKDDMELVVFKCKSQEQLY
ncbi:hypothetical protein RND81_12G093000 [Saponaria officinalis]|uniref:RRM domain-containing protein n=1 Tax=Saponaria officinalis TaxID=3572 RepID=A0AAW1H8E8_SAPOF